MMYLGMLPSYLERGMFDGQIGMMYLGMLPSYLEREICARFRGIGK